MIGLNLAIAGCCSAIARARQLIDLDSSDPGDEITTLITTAWNVAWDGPNAVLRDVDATLRIWNRRRVLDAASRHGADLCADVHVAWHAWPPQSRHGTWRPT